eukprot:CAMPEP_0202477740 /NCGR_PEP_ID=MMETSP1360-20130828/94098_1 /ASSEMBLY_ACC=CAM_ASM_000848 /TAXON_ID=515479 /ORGANISM="Licmophora paradoxa, Strain CCMP2313" /LENGTH=452 /DNA_ID=CAMNT_0049104991 /DNA_START=236 /DNA_END=1591 /DNA_ORIENTATION=-
MESSRDLFLKAWKGYDLTKLPWLTFTTLNDFQRRYPGRHSCDKTYEDPRKQPWFTASISARKRILILVDHKVAFGDGLSIETIQYINQTLGRHSCDETYEDPHKQPWFTASISARKRILILVDHKVAFEDDLSIETIQYINQTLAPHDEVTFLLVGGTNSTTHKTTNFDALNASIHVDPGNEMSDFGGQYVMDHITEWLSNNYDNNYVRGIVFVTSKDNASLNHTFGETLSEHLPKTVPVFVYLTEPFGSSGWIDSDRFCSNNDLYFVSTMSRKNSWKFLNNFYLVFARAMYVAVEQWKRGNQDDAGIVVSDTTDSSTGTLSEITVSKALFDPDGLLLGVLSMHLSLSQFDETRKQKLLAQVRIQDEWFWSESDHMKEFGSCIIPRIGNITDSKRNNSTCANQPALKCETNHASQCNYGALARENFEHSVFPIKKDYNPCPQNDSNKKDWMA